MLEEISNQKFMEWVAYVQIEAEERAAAEKKAQNQSNGNKVTYSLGEE